MKRGGLLDVYHDFFWVALIAGIVYFIQKAAGFPGALVEIARKILLWIFLKKDMPRVRSIKKSLSKRKRTWDIEEIIGVVSLDRGLVWS